MTNIGHFPSSDHVTPNYRPDLRPDRILDLRADIGRDADEPPDMSGAVMRTDEFGQWADYHYERAGDR